MSLRVGDIPAELTRIWDTLDGTGKVRASLFTLILYTQKNARAAYIRALTKNVVERFPCRVIFITVDKTNPEDALEASASIMAGSQDVACDLIEIQASGSYQARIPFLILPYLIPDLPVYLLWAEDPTKENPLSHQLELLATRIIFDSEATNDISEFAQVVLQHQKEASVGISDLNWARMENWRELFSASFYSEERLQQLKSTKTLSIVYNAHETQFFCHTKIQALYLQAWLTTRLGWNLKNITVNLTPEIHTELSPGTIISVELHSHHGDVVSFCRHPEQPEKIKTIFCTHESCEIPSTYIFTKTERGLSLIREIGHGTESSHFIDVLHLLSKTQIC